MKKGFQLSMNFIVIIILSIIILFFGILFGRNIITEGLEMNDKIGEQTRVEIERMLESNARVAIPLSKQVIKRGNFGKFGLGILNIDENNPDFRVNVELDKGVTEEGIDIPPEDIPAEFTDSQHLVYRSLMNIPVNKKDYTAIAIAVPKTVLSGTYIFNVYVCSGNPVPGICDRDSELYDSHIKKIYVEIP